MLSANFSSARVLALCGCCLLTSGLAAAPPRVDRLFPAGACRGSSAAITVTGQFPQWPASFWTSHRGITVEPQSDKGKIKLTIAEDVPPGVHWLRCFHDEGASSPRPFVVGTLPEVEEAEPNDSPSKPQQVAARVLVNGRLARTNDVDGFVMDLRKGDQLVASLQANVGLGSPMDAVLQVCWLVEQPGRTGPPDAFVVQQTDDTVGIDPLLVYPVPRDGKYLVRVFAFPQEPNSTIGFAGGDEFVYRLTLTTGGYVDYARPLAVTASSSAEVELGGWNIPPDLCRLTITPEDDETCIAFHPQLASSANITVVNHPVAVYAPDGDSPTPHRLTIPITVTGRLSRDAQRDVFVFSAEKGKKYRLQVEARTLGYDTDPLVRINDSSGKRLDESDDARESRDAELVFSAPESGDFQVEVQDVHGLSGPRHLYRLTVQEVLPDFALSLSNDSFAVAAGKTVEIPVTIERREGFNEAISLRVEGLPEGVTAAPAMAEKSADAGKSGTASFPRRSRRGGRSDNAGGSSNSVKLVLTVGESAKPFQGPIQIRGVADAATPPRSRTATYTLREFGAQRTDIWLSVAAGK